MSNTDVKKRQQLIDIIGINIPPARCSAYLKTYLFNDPIETEIKVLRNKKKELTASDEITVIEKQIVTLSKKIIRISNETSTTIAIICNYFIEELIKHCITEISTNNKKFFDITNIMAGDHKNNTAYFLYCKLPSFLNYNQKTYEDQKKEQQENNKKMKKQKTVPEVDTEEVPNGKNKKKKQLSQPVDKSTETTPEDGSKLSFTTYINLMIKNQINGLELENKESIRITKDGKLFLSNLIVECIKRFVVLSKIIIQQFMNVRTMTSNHVKAIICMLMKDENKTDDEIGRIINVIDSKIKVFQEHVKNEKHNKGTEGTATANTTPVPKENEVIKVKKQPVKKSKDEVKKVSNELKNE